MRLQTALVPACSVTPDTFIYDEKKKMFFFIDDIEIDYDMVTFIFEPDFNTYIKRRYRVNQLVVVVTCFHQPRNEYSPKRVMKRANEYNSVEA